MTNRLLVSLCSVLALATIPGCVDPASVQVGDPSPRTAGGETSDGACDVDADAPRAVRTLSLPVAQYGSRDVRRSGAVVQLFPGGAIRGGEGCVAPACTQVTSDDAGTISATLGMGSRIAYRVLPDADGAFVPTLAVGVSLAGERESIHAMPRALLDAMLAHAAIARDGSRGHLAGVVRDCRGAPIAGARLRVIDEDGRELPARDAPVLVSDPSTPALLTAGGDATTGSGRFAIVNLEPARTLRIEAWTSSASGARRVACRAAPVERDALTIVSLRGCEDGR
ncbi:MAG: hypothetical protein M3Y87_12865 [Myxococcota bacterium]|nr:hypothetical protein [Myxococcota bacterium]